MLTFTPSVMERAVFCEIFLLQNSPFLKYPPSLKLKKVMNQVLYQYMQFRFI